MAKRHISKSSILILVSCVAVSSLLALGWMVVREIFPNNPTTVFESKENIVVNNVGASSDLVSALLKEPSGCPVHKNTDYIDKQTAGFAIVRYGCGLDAITIYKQSGSSWVALNTTNQLVNGIPYCEFAKNNKVPEAIEPFCYDGSFQNGQLPNVISNPVK